MLPKTGKHTQNLPPEPCLLLQMHFSIDFCKVFREGSSSQRPASCTTNVSERTNSSKIFPSLQSGDAFLPSPGDACAAAVKAGMSKVLSWAAEQGVNPWAEGAQGLTGWGISLLISFSGFQVGFS